MGTEHSAALDEMQAAWLNVPLNKAQLHLLQHSLGVNQYGQGPHYRNRFITGLGSTDWPLCMGLCALGLMEDHGSYAIAGGDHCFTVTPKGVEIMREQSPKPPKLTPSAQRYRKWLHADSGMKFGEWLKQNMENYESEVR